MISFLKRSTQSEKMDEPDFSKEDLESSFRMIRKVNRYLGGTQTILSHLKRFSKTWDSKKSITILDIGTGCADIPIQILKWAKSNFFQIQIYALDSNWKTLQYARQFSHLYPEIQLIEADALNLPFQPKSIDYVISSMFFHHLSDKQIIELLNKIDQIARKGVIMNDLARHRRAYFWISLMTAFVSKSHLRSDAQISILRGFKRNELWNYIQQANVPYLNVYRHFGHRIVLAGKKQ